jgi:hypothetical protein
MKLDDRWRRALSGETFSSADAFRVDAAADDPATRFDAARRLAAGRRVLHVGCVDHLPLIDQKIAAGTWMHEVLVGAAGHCGGVDIDPVGIDALRSRGYSDLWIDDIANPSTDVVTQGWDLLFLGEMVEHLDDPVSYLARVREVWQGRCRSLALTVPNAFGWATLRAALAQGAESINTDHRYWFTPYTIAKVATRAGLDVERLYLCEAFGRVDGGLLSRSKQQLLQAVLARRPLLRSVIVVELTL